MPRAWAAFVGPCLGLSCLCFFWSLLVTSKCGWEGTMPWTSLERKDLESSGQVALLLSALAIPSSLTCSQAGHHAPPLCFLPWALPPSSVLGTPVPLVCLRWIGWEKSKELMVGEVLEGAGGPCRRQTLGSRRPAPGSRFVSQGYSPAAFCFHQLRPRPRAGPSASTQRCSPGEWYHSPGGPGKKSPCGKG